MKHKLIKTIAFILILCLTFSTPLSAKADGNSDGGLDLSEISAEDRNGNALPYFDSDELGHITYKREHTAATTGVHYNTQYLIMSAQPITIEGRNATDITQQITSGNATKSSPYVRVDLTGRQDGRPDHGKITTTYSFNNSDIEAVAKDIFGVTDDDEDGFIEIYISHVFEIAPSSQSAWDNLKSAIGKVSNSANSKSVNGGKSHYLTANKYDNNSDPLSWYRTMEEFVKPGGDSTFWSNGDANVLMYDCANIKLRVKVNPNVYGAPLTVYLYDYDAKVKYPLRTITGMKILLNQGCVFGARTLAMADERGYPYITIGRTNYYLWEGDGIAVLQSKRNAAGGGFTGDIDNDSREMTSVSKRNYVVDLYKGCVTKGTVLLVTNCVTKRTVPLAIPYG